MRSPTNSMTQSRERNTTDCDHDSHQESRSKETLFFSLDWELNRIPEPGPCSYCGAPRQREFVESYEVHTTRYIVRALDAPGYGCTGCSLKGFPDLVAIRLLKDSAELLRSRGDTETANQLDCDALALAEQFTPPTGHRNGG